MGSHRAKALALFLAAITQPALAIEAGWQVSPLPGEGDRASLGCARDSTDTNFACLAVRCEDDFSVGIHVHTSRAAGHAGTWEMTLDREDRSFAATVVPSPYGARLDDADGFLLDRIRHGAFIYLRHADDREAPFRYIGLSGSFRAIEEALYWCAPRVPAEQILAPDVDRDTPMEKQNEPSPAGTQ
jgi:hypothetical protein